MKKEETIHVILTGGTIDSYFNPTTDSTTVADKSSVVGYIKQLKLHDKFRFTVAAMKDSRELRYKDREHILELINKSPERMILITHGTYTMPDTGQYLKDNLQKTKKTIVLVGSMIPLKGFDFSDAGFNLGYGIASLQNLKPGVYICMNGKVFDPDQVDKNKIKGRFEEVE